MFNIKKHLKLVGMINAVLIGIVIICGFIVFFSNDCPVDCKYSMPVHIMALLVGLAYAVNGYKKEAATTYYKFFMLAAAFSYLTTLVCSFQGHPQGFVRITGVLILVVNLLIQLILAFAKDLGKEKSVFLAIITLALNLISTGIFIVVEQFSSSPFPVVVNTLQLTVISIVTCTFVFAKFADKENRGTK